MPVDFMGRLYTVVGVILALSISSERLVEIIRAWFPSLNVKAPDDDKPETLIAEAKRRAGLHLLSLFAGVLTSLLATYSLSQIVPIPRTGAGEIDLAMYTVEILGLGLLASGGSGFWNTILGYLIQVREMKVREAPRKVSDPMA
jgi:hypothetical protein